MQIGKTSVLHVTSLTINNKTHIDLKANLVLKNFLLQKPGLPSFPRILARRAFLGRSWSMSGMTLDYFERLFAALERPIPIPAGIAGCAAVSGLGFSATIASVAMRSPAIEAAS